MTAAMDRIRREDREKYGPPPTTPREALEHTVAVVAGDPDETVVATATVNVYDDAPWTGLRLRDLRALADTAAAQDRARAVAQQMLAGLMPGDTGVNVANEIADKITAAVLNTNTKGTR